MQSFENKKNLTSKKCGKILVSTPRSCAEKGGGSHWKTFKLKMKHTVAVMQLSQERKQCTTCNKGTVLRKAYHPPLHRLFLHATKQNTDVIPRLSRLQAAAPAGAIPIPSVFFKKKYLWLLQTHVGLTTALKSRVCTPCKLQIAQPNSPPPPHLQHPWKALPCIATPYAPYGTALQAGCKLAGGLDNAVAGENDVELPPSLFHRLPEGLHCGAYSFLGGSVAVDGQLVPRLDGALSHGPVVGQTKKTN